MHSLQMAAVTVSCSVNIFQTAIAAQSMFPRLYRSISHRHAQFADSSCHREPLNQYFPDCTAASPTDMHSLQTAAVTMSRSVNISQTVPRNPTHTHPQLADGSCHCEPCSQYFPHCSAASLVGRVSRHLSAMPWQAWHVAKRQRRALLASMRHLPGPSHKCVCGVCVCVCVCVCVSVE